LGYNPTDLVELQQRALTMVEATVPVGLLAPLKQNRSAHAEDG
jgi:hypothetical protein